MSANTPEPLTCVHCEKEYTADDNFNGACSYHSGAYGRCGPIKKGNGWTCCGREVREKGCHTGYHTTVADESPPRLVDEMEEMMKRGNSSSSLTKKSGV